MTGLKGGRGKETSVLTRWTQELVIVFVGEEWKVFTARLVREQF